jgi:energy-coupling factor transport system substrate-specific component
LTLLGFSRYQWAAIIAVGIITPLVDSRVEVLLPTFFYQIRGVVNVFDFTGGPVNSDLLVAWEEYGGVVAAFLVRKPGAATIAMTINGFMQFYIDGFSGPHHLLYGVTGLGAEVGFAIFRYRRYDALVSMLAGVLAQVFWLPVTYPYHAVFTRFPPSWFPGDLVARLLGGAVGDGLMGFAIGLAVLGLVMLVQTERHRGELPSAREARKNDLMMRPAGLTREPSRRGARGSGSRDGQSH